MSKLSKYMKLKEKVEQAQQKADKAEGALEQVMGRLKAEFDCPTLNATEKKLTQKRKKEAVAEEEFNTAVEQFEKDWSDELD